MPLIFYTMAIYIIIIYALIFISFFISFFILSKRLKKIKDEIEISQEKKESIEIANDCLQARNKTLSFSLQKQQEEKDNCQKEVDLLILQKANLIDTIETQNRTFEKTRESAKKNFDEYYRAAEEATNLKIEELEKVYQISKEKCENGYEEAAKELNSLYLSKMELERQKIEKAKEELADIKGKVDAATEINRRTSGEKMELEKYKIIIPEDDIKEIKVLRSVESQLRNPEALNKIVWTYYYQKPVNALVSRVIGPTVKSGIYKITNLENGMIYIGQAVDLGSRWKQHVKRGLGAEAQTRNALYPAMKQFGPENFSYEVVEYCSNAELNDKEKFWIEFYNGKEYGYNLRLG